MSETAPPLRKCGTHFFLIFFFHIIRNFELQFVINFSFLNFKIPNKVQKKNIYGFH